MKRKKSPLRIVLTIISVILTVAVVCAVAYVLWYLYNNGASILTRPGNHVLLA